MYDVLYVYPALQLVMEGICFEYLDTLSQSPFAILVCASPNPLFRLRHLQVQRNAV
jgi:hypothetical protein